MSGLVGGIGIGATRTVRAIDRGRGRPRFDCHLRSVGASEAGSYETVRRTSPHRLTSSSASVVHASGIPVPASTATVPTSEIDDDPPAVVSGEDNATQPASAPCGGCAGCHGCGRRARRRTRCRPSAQSGSPRSRVEASVDRSEAGREVAKGHGLLRIGRLDRRQHVQQPAREHCRLVALLCVQQVQQGEEAPGRLRGAGPSASRGPRAAGEMSGSCRAWSVSE